MNVNIVGSIEQLNYFNYLNSKIIKKKYLENE